MRIVALDLSLTSTGYADSAGPVGTIKPPEENARGVKRLSWITSRVIDLVRGADLVVVEDYSYASKGRAVIDIGEMGGCVRLSLYLNHYPFAEIAPGQRTKYATGSGNAPKDAVFAEAIRRLGYAGHSNDEADALWLLQMALAHYGLSGAVDVPAKNREALEKVEWPKIPSAK